MRHFSFRCRTAGEGGLLNWFFSNHFYLYLKKKTLLQRTYPLLYNCPRKQRPRGERGPFSSISKNPVYRSCLQRLDPTCSRMKQHLEYINKHLMLWLLEYPVFWYQTQNDPITAKITYRLWKQLQEKFSWEGVSRSWTGCIKNPADFLVPFSHSHVTFFRSVRLRAPLNPVL